MPHASRPTTQNGPNAAAGPLIVSRKNPRYFAIANDTGDERAVYLTGSHIWNNLHDGLGPGRECAGNPERNDFEAYLRFLERYGHNFIRLWRWEQFRSQAAGGNFHLCMTPQPWPPDALRERYRDFDRALGRALVPAIRARQRGAMSTPKCSWKRA